MLTVLLEYIDLIFTRILDIIPAQFVTIRIYLVYMCMRKTGLMLFILFLYCIRFSKSVSCMRFPITSCINGKFVLESYAHIKGCT